MDFNTPEWLAIKEKYIKIVQECDAKTAPIQKIRDDAYKSLCSMENVEKIFHTAPIGMAILERKNE